MQAAGARRRAAPPGERRPGAASPAAPRVSGRSKKARTAPAMTPPTPSTAAISSTGAPAIRSIDPKASASARAAEHADVADSEAVEQPIDGAILGGGDGGRQVGDRLLLEAGELADLGGGQRRRCRPGWRSGFDPAARRRSARPGARCPSRRAPRSGRCAPAPAPGTAGSGSAPPLRPRGARSAVPQTGQSTGMTKARSLPSRRLGMGATTSGITSPARRTTTVSPMRTPLRTTSCALCSVAIEMVTPPTRTGSRMANGVTAPVRPTEAWMSRSLVVCSSAGNL